MRLLRSTPRRVRRSSHRAVSDSSRSRWLRAALVLSVLGLAGVWVYVFKRDAGPVAPIGKTKREANFATFGSLGGSCDVLVVGGTSSGVAAALAAARRGSRVILVEGRPHLGGDIVYAMLNMFDVPARPHEKSPVSGIFAEFYHQLGTAFDIDEARRMIENSVTDQPGIQVMTHTRVARIIKDGDRVSGVVLHHTYDASDPDAVGIEANDPDTSEKEIAVRVVVDATDDASFAARAGAGYYVGRENVNRDKRMQSAGLLFSVSGVNWNRVRDYVGGKRPMIALPKSKKRRTLPLAPLSTSPPSTTAASTASPSPTSSSGRASQASLSGDSSGTSILPVANARNTKANSRPESVSGAARSAQKGGRNRAAPNRAAPNRVNRKVRRKIVWLRRGGAHGNYAWERGDIVRDYRPRGRHILFLSINFGRQDDGTVVLNTLNIVGVNGLDGRSKRAAMCEAQAELPAFINYLRKKMPGFKHARLAHVAPELYIRETRHIHGYYALKVEDIRAQRRFFDRVARVSYPLDLHPYVMGQANPFGRRRYFYTLPLRCLVPRHVDCVFVASRSLSATYSAAGSARVIPIIMAAGEACGAAASLCAQQDITPHDMMQNSKWVSDLQVSLREMGADIGDDLPPPRNNMEETPSDAARTTSKTPSPIVKTP